MSTATMSPAPPTGTIKGDGPPRRLFTLHLRDYAIVGFLVLLFVVLALSTDTFLTIANLKNVLAGASTTGLIAVAATIVIISGGFDISAGAIFTVAAIIGAKVSNEFNPLVGIVVGFAAGCLLGLVNGLLITVARIPSFVATLGTMTAFGGLAAVISGTGLVSIDDDSFSAIANTEFLGIRTTIWVLILVALFGGFILNWTVFGRRVYSIGGNLAAARLSGIPVNRVIVGCFVFSGAIAGVAGLLSAAGTLSVSSTTGQMIIFDALAAVLIGGNHAFGGEGAIWRTIVGVAILALISNGFNLIGVDPIYQQVVSGVIILVAVAADGWTRQKH